MTNKRGEELDELAEDQAEDLEAQQQEALDALTSDTIEATDPSGNPVEIALTESQQGDRIASAGIPVDEDGNYIEPDVVDEDDVDEDV